MDNSPPLSGPSADETGSPCSDLTLKTSSSQSMYGLSFVFIASNVLASFSSERTLTPLEKSTEMSKAISCQAFYQSSSGRNLLYLRPSFILLTMYSAVSFDYSCWSEVSVKN